MSCRRCPPDFETCTFCHKGPLPDTKTIAPINPGRVQALRDAMAAALELLRPYPGADGERLEAASLLSCALEEDERAAGR